MLTKKEARMLAYDFILEGKKCFANLDDEDKEQIAGLIIEGSYEIEAQEYVTESDIKSELPYMLAKYMKNKDELIGKHILEFMVKNAVNHAYKQIEEILEDQEKEYEFNLKYDMEGNI